MNNPDKLEEIFKDRESFMEMIKAKFEDTYPSWPVDLSSKNSQKVCRETALKGVEEMFEALQHLKIWKPHKKTEVDEFDREEFLEEIVDAFNYFLSILVLTGVTSEELFATYVKKDDIIHKRLQTGY